MGVENDEDAGEKLNNITIGSGLLDTSKIEQQMYNGDRDDISTTSQMNIEKDVNNNIVNIDNKITDHIGMKINDNYSNTTLEDSGKSQYVAGTTWVFEDGSQVILKPQTASVGDDNDDDFDDFCNEFEQTTGGENFDQMKDLSATRKKEYINESETGTESSSSHSYSMLPSQPQTQDHIQKKGNGDNVSLKSEPTTDL